MPWLDSHSTMVEGRGMRIAGVVVLVLVSGCSLLTVRGAPSSDPGVRPVHCTESRGAPVVDTVTASALLGPAVFLLSLGIYLAATDPGGSDVPNPGGLAIIAGIPLGIAGLPFAVSAWRGYTATGRCRRMNHTPLPARPASVPSGSRSAF